MYDVKFCISGMGGSYFTFSAMGFGVFVGHVGQEMASRGVGIGVFLGKRKYSYCKLWMDIEYSKRLAALYTSQ
jgi:hypothetical protein